MSESTEVNLGKAVSVQTILQGVQTLVLLGSIAAVFLTIGRRDATLDAQEFVSRSWPRSPQTLPRPSDH